MDGGTGAVSLTASGLLTAGTGEQVTTTEHPDGVGHLQSVASAALFNTTVGKLNATATSGDIFVSQSGALELVAASATGAVSVSTGQGTAAGGAITVDSAGGNGVTVTAGGAGSGISVGGAVTGGAGGATLTAGGAITAAVGSSVGGDSITLTGTAIGTSTALR